MQHRTLGNAGVSVSALGLAAIDVKLSPEDLRQINAVAPPGVAAGDRYPANMIATLNR